MKAAVVIPNRNGRELLAAALESLRGQTRPAAVIVVDDCSDDGADEMVRERFPEVELIRNETNLGFARTCNRGAAAAADADVVILLNNDVIASPRFVEAILAPFADPATGSAAGVLTQLGKPDRIDTAGIELDPTLRSWDLGWNRPAAWLAGAPDPAGPCGGAAAYRASAWREAGGFDEAFFAYWEDVDLALRLRAAGWRCVLAPDARAEHRHGGSFGASSPLQRRLHHFGRGYVLAKHRPAGRVLLRRLGAALLDWPELLVHLFVRREIAPIRERRRGLRLGRRNALATAPERFVTVPFREALRRQWLFLRLRLRGELPDHF